MESNNLTDAQLEFWNLNGYLVIENAVPKADVESVLKTIWEFLEMDSTDPNDWYDTDLRKKSGIDPRGMIPLYNHQSLWNCRQNDTIYNAFCDIYNCKELLVSIDRVNMNPPKTNEWNYTGFIHWDIDTSKKPLPFQLQGLLSLTDSNENSGGFQCVPGFQHKIKDWLEKQPAGYNERFPDTTGMKIIPVPVNAGDFLIWQGALPHGNSENLSGKPRLAQYITMFPATECSANEKESRIKSFEENIPPFSVQGKQFPVSPRQNLPKTKIDLTPLGKRLLGLESYR